MLTDFTLRNLKPRATLYKVVDRDGMYVPPTTRAMRKSVLDRDILPIFKKRLLSEVQAEDLLALCLRVKGRGAPTVALNIREIIKLDLWLREMAQVRFRALSPWRCPSIGSGR